MTKATFSAGQKVRHAKHGLGEVMMQTDQTTIIRFEGGISEVLSSELSKERDFYGALVAGEQDNFERTLLHFQAEIIRHLNDSWGVFSRSRIALLPHQLWVCRQVLQTWPPRWLIADDMGLGKTVEAGLILWPLLTRRQVSRLLILTPASLTRQWQTRLKQMFDIRLTVYDAQADRPAPEGSTYWDIHHQVVASLQTLREDKSGRHERLLSSAPWDLVIVDEAHHLSAYEGAGSSLSYQLLRKLQTEHKIGGLLLFTATPHKGKDYGFLALLELLRPDLFSVSESLENQLSGLRETVIRNNKQRVTNLSGERLFLPPLVSSEEYSYSAEEALFYSRMSDFIASGQAYASNLTNQRDSRAIGLVLTSLQKLASSSVAAVRRALEGRKGKIGEHIHSLEKKLAHYQEWQQFDSDEAAQIEEEVGQWGLMLMEDEQRRIEELLELAAEISSETKIETILQAIEERYEGRSVLLFTEYKATQSLLLTELSRRYGREQVTFINGDERACIDGEWIDQPRERAADQFNSGTVRFLVSTEAAGEGIDLQRSCHTLIHVDLPWNPMRLHQRVGRLNRYGQTKQVEVLSLRNPTTVEARIWQLLNEKLDNISQAFVEVMDEPEDLMQLVLGMTSPKLFDQLFTSIKPSQMQQWLDEQTAHLSGHGLVETVESLVGSANRFDFEEVSPFIPRVDLPDLLPFMRRSLRLNHRAFKEDNLTLSFKTPESWLGEFGIQREYRSLSFSRESDGQDVAGVGHRAVDKALAQARQEWRGFVTAVQGLGGDLYLYRISERLTDQPGHRIALVGWLAATEGEGQWLRDWEILQRLGGELVAGQADIKAHYLEKAQQGEQRLANALEELGLHYVSPNIEAVGLLIAE